MTATWASVGTAMPALSARTPSTKTSPAIISAWARLRVSARPRATSSRSSRSFCWAMSLGDLLPLQLLQPAGVSILQRLAQVNLRLPSGVGLQAGGAAVEHRQFGWPHALRVVAALHLDAGDVNQRVEQVVNGDRLPGGDDVVAARLAALGQALVGADDVAHVAEVALGVEVAHAHLRRAHPQGDGGKLAGEIGDDEARLLAGANVVEGARLDDGQLVALPVHRHEPAGGPLAQPVGMARVRLAGLGDGQVRLRYVAVDFGAGDGDDARAAKADGCFQDIGRAAGVDGQRARRVLPGGRRQRPAGEMVDNVGPRQLHRRLERVQVLQVAFHRRVGRRVGFVPAPVALESEAEDLMAFGEQIVNQMGAGKARSAGDENTHTFSCRAGLWRPLYRKN